MPAARSVPMVSMKSVRGTQSIGIVSDSASSYSVKSSIASVNNLGILFCVLLAFQFGLQPILVKKFQSKAINPTSVVLMTEFFKIVIAGVLLSTRESPSTLRDIWGKLTLASSLRYCALPGLLYAIQNIMTQYGYRYLDSMTYNLLNQTKTLSTAFFCYILLDVKQSFQQLLGLFLLFIAAIVLQMDNNTIDNIPTIAMTFFKNINLDYIQNWYFNTIVPYMKSDMTAVGTYIIGLNMVGMASLISGLSTALTQIAVTDKNPNGTPKVANRHTVFFSAELAVYGIIFLLLNSFMENLLPHLIALWNSSQSSDSGKSSIIDIVQYGFISLFQHWDWKVLIPVASNAGGGIIVGLVTKYAGGVNKGYALIAGIIITGFAQFVSEGESLKKAHFVAMVLVSVSIYLNSKYPYRANTSQAKGIKTD
jgi:UDP-sugar transporter A1/2/3